MVMVSLPVAGIAPINHKISTSLRVFFHFVQFNKFSLHGTNKIDYDECYSVREIQIENEKLLFGNWWKYIQM